MYVVTEELELQLPSMQLGCLACGEERPALLPSTLSEEGACIEVLLDMNADMDYSKPCGLELGAQRHSQPTLSVPAELLSWEQFAAQRAEPTQPQQVIWAQALPMSEPCSQQASQEARCQNPTAAMVPQAVSSAADSAALWVPHCTAKAPPSAPQLPASAPDPVAVLQLSSPFAGPAVQTETPAQLRLQEPSEFWVSGPGPTCVAVPISMHVAVSVPATSGSSNSTAQHNISRAPSTPTIGVAVKEQVVPGYFTFDEYEAQYGRAAKCATGVCASTCSLPCKTHVCKCCKLHRRLHAPGNTRSKGYCGLCSNRQKVTGLEFVRCGHQSVVDGQIVKCNAEMLRHVFDNHWKQHKSQDQITYEKLAIDEGRSCHTCTNMRPTSYYPNQDGVSSCNHCQNTRAKSNRLREATFTTQASQSLAAIKADSPHSVAEGNWPGVQQVPTCPASSSPSSSKKNGKRAGDVTTEGCHAPPVKRSRSDLAELYAQPILGNAATDQETEGDAHSDTSMMAQHSLPREFRAAAVQPESSLLAAGLEPDMMDLVDTNQADSAQLMQLAKELGLQIETTAPEAPADLAFTMPADPPKTSMVPLLTTMDTHTTTLMRGPEATLACPVRRPSNHTASSQEHFSGVVTTQGPGGFGGRDTFISPNETDTPSPVNTPLFDDTPAAAVCMQPAATVPCRAHVIAVASPVSTVMSEEQLVGQVQQLLSSTVRMVQLAGPALGKWAELRRSKQQQQQQQVPQTCGLQQHLMATCQALQQELLHLSAGLQHLE